MDSKEGQDLTTIHHGNNPKYKQAHNNLVAILSQDGFIVWPKISAKGISFEALKNTAWRFYHTTEKMGRTRRSELSN